MRLFLALLLGMMMLAACSARPPVEKPSSGAAKALDAAPTASAWRAECLKATLRALSMERSRYAMWLKGAAPNSKEQADYLRAIHYIDELTAKFRKMSPSEFTVEQAYRYVPVTGIPPSHSPSADSPKPIVLEDAWVSEPLPGGLLNFSGMTRSGPFYRVVGAPDDNFKAIKPKVHYRMVIQPLMRESYPFPSYYVCIKSFEPLKK